MDYSGSAQELIEAGQASVGKMLYAIGDKNGPTETYSEPIPAKTEAGTYYIWFKDSSGNIYNYPFYLGIYDSPDNYEESTEEEYLLFLESQKEIEEPVENNE